MSLYDKMIIGFGSGFGIKVSILFNLKPIDGTGDFSLVRSKTGTIVNNIGIVENIAIDTPRSDFPVGGSINGCPNLLLEKAVTNLMFRSEDWSHASWLKIRNTVVADSIASPDGATTADSIIASVDNNNHRTQQTRTVTASQSYTVSCFVKKGDRNFAYITMEASSPNVADTAYFDINLGVLGSKGSNIDFSTIENYGNDWYKITVTKLSVTGGSQIFMICFADGDLTPNWIGDASTVSGYMWGGELKNLPYNTSYIKTEGASVTSAADACNNAGTSSIFNDDEGVLYCEIAAHYNDLTDRIITISDGSSSNSILIKYYAVSNTIQAQIIDGGAIQSQLIGAVSDITDFHKIAVRYKLNDCKLFIDGVEVATDTSAIMPTGLSELSFDNGGGANDFYGRCKEIAVFDDLTDLELIQLTTI